MDRSRRPTRHPTAKADPLLTRAAIRPAQAADADDLAGLAAELGYPTPAARGCRRMVVGTRVTRERAHRFYAREEYEVTKTSYFLAKDLSGGVNG